MFVIPELNPNTTWMSKGANSTHIDMLPTHYKPLADSKTKICLNKNWLMNIIWDARNICKLHHHGILKRKEGVRSLISYQEEGLFFTAFKHGLILINFMQPKYRTWGWSKHTWIRAQNVDLLQVQIFSTTQALKYTYILGLSKKICALSFSNTQNSSVHCSAGKGGDIPPSLYVPTHIPDRLSPTGHWPIDNITPTPVVSIG